MLTELKRCNSVGDIDGIVFFASILAGNKKVRKDELRNRCALERDIVLNFPGVLAFFHYLGLIDIKGESVSSTTELKEIAEKGRNVIVEYLVEACINKLVQDGIFDKDATRFDAEKGHLAIKRSAFPLEYAAIRNFLILAGALDKASDSEICISSDYESDWTQQLRERRKKYTLEQLLNQQEEQSKRGLEAEEFVLGLERQRIPDLAQRIKRISDFDVTAGYDIVSFENSSSDHYDRFIEVKSYIDSPRFFWSENEVDVAKLLRNKYVLCLVNYGKIKEPGYMPDFIVDPYEVIFKGGGWLTSASSYRIQKI
jgi:hypothetical protein